MTMLIASHVGAENLVDLFAPIFRHNVSSIKLGIVNGQKVKGSYNGMGIIKFQNGDIYFGDMLDGKPDGSGVYICDNNNYLINDKSAKFFIGCFGKGLKIKGKCLDEQSKIIYNGSFVKDKPDLAETDNSDEPSGFIHYFRSEKNEMIYVGELTQGIPHGKGILIFSNGDYILSDFKYGKRNGIGLLMFHTGEWQSEKVSKGKTRVISTSTYYNQLAAERDQQEQHMKAALSEALSEFGNLLSTIGELVPQYKNIGKNQNNTTDTTSGGTSNTGKNNNADKTSYNQTSVYGASSIGSFDMSVDDSSLPTTKRLLYENQYANWERRAESHYKSLTNLGLSWKKKNGEREGSAGGAEHIKGSDYMMMEKALHEAQREMVKIRNKAAKEGITITQSAWETSTVRWY